MRHVVIVSQSRPIKIIFFAFKTVSKENAPDSRYLPQKQWFPQVSLVRLKSPDLKHYKILFNMPYVIGIDGIGGTRLYN